MFSRPLSLDCQFHNHLILRSMAFRVCFLVQVAFAFVNIIAEAQQIQSNISRSSYLTPTTNSSWLSHSGLYAFGFYNQGNGYGVGIMLARIPQKTLVWTANRDKPLVSNNATLLFTNDGLALRSTEGQTPVVTSADVASASMRDSGNFVLYNSNGDIVWQSFENPTDTLLPKQRLSAGQELFSSKSEMDHSTGIFHLNMQHDGNLVQYPVNAVAVQNAYYASGTAGSGDNVTLNLNVDGHLYLLNTIGSNIKNITEGGLPTAESGKLIYLMRIDADGIFRLYSHNLEQNGNWSIEWSSSKDKCEPKGLCGFNSYCSTNHLEAECTCIPGFQPVKPGNWTPGCERNFVADVCKYKIENFTCTVLEVDNTMFENDQYMALTSTDKEVCKQACLEDSNCEAALFDNVSCTKQRLPLRFGRRHASISSTALIKASIKPSTNIEKAEEGGSSGQNKQRLLLIILTTTAAVVLVLGSMMCYFRMRMHKPKAKESESRANYMATAGKFNSNVPNLQVFGITDIEAATDGFSIEYKLGEGGYGPVYKGLLPNGQEIAVKKLSKASTQGFEEFKNEVMLTAKLQHINLVKVLGFCIERHEQMLIYEYMPNKSLDLYLFDPIRRYQLDWRKRVHIIEGVTQGLLYLQEYSRLTIIHRDLKSSNILLDDEMRPKISDFGMARIFTKDVLEANTDRIVGTYGYIPPEYVKKGLYSTKSDVYSFGVLLLQIISGKRNLCFSASNEDTNLLEYAYELWKEGKGMDFMDPSLEDTQSLCKLMRCLQIALLCVQEDANDRPSMLEISSMLKNETATMANPKKPAFSRRNEDEETNPTSRLEICSINHASISEVVGR